MTISAFAIILDIVVQISFLLQTDFFVFAQSGRLEFYGSLALQTLLSEKKAHRAKRFLM